MSRRTRLTAEQLLKSKNSELSGQLEQNDEQNGGAFNFKSADETETRNSYAEIGHYIAQMARQFDKLTINGQLVAKEDYPLNPIDGAGKLSQEEHEEALGEQACNELAGLTAEHASKLNRNNVSQRAFQFLLNASAYYKDNFLTPATDGLKSSAAISIEGEGISCKYDIDALVLETAGFYEADEKTYRTKGSVSTFTEITDGGEILLSIECPKSLEDLFMNEKKDTMSEYLKAYGFSEVLSHGSTQHLADDDSDSVDSVTLSGPRSPTTLIVTNDPYDEGKETVPWEESGDTACASVDRQAQATATKQSPSWVHKAARFFKAIAPPEPWAGTTAPKADKATDQHSNTEAASRPMHKL